MWDSSSHMPGIELRTPEVGAWSVSHWTTEVLSNGFLSCFPEDSIDAINTDSQNVPPMHTAGATHSVMNLRTPIGRYDKVPGDSTRLPSAPTPPLPTLLPGHICNWLGREQVFPYWPRRHSVPLLRDIHINGCRWPDSECINMLAPT